MKTDHTLYVESWGEAQQSALFSDQLIVKKIPDPSLSSK
jgi:hypothetical protein